MTTHKASSLSDVEKAVEHTNQMIIAGATGDASQKQLDKAAENESKVVQAYVQDQHEAAQAEAQAEAEAGE